ncbi:MAG: hypothetical protein JSS67_09285 [Bacteroidetes bacterium]|nr:hypothetical protein [Bacteroidota bacterium]
MKKMFITLFAGLMIIYSQAQNKTGILKDQKDVWGTSYTYTGEIKNGKPDGFGVAAYKNELALKYVGQFVNGVMQGKGSMLFNNGAFLTGDWKNGKVDGQGSNLNKEGTFYHGGLKDGLRSGYGWLVLKSNAFYLGEFKNDTYNGVGIYGWADGRTLGQNIYVDGKRNGPGYQFEGKSNTIFQGTWKDDEWQSASTAPFKSFLNAEGFRSDTSTTQILLAKLDAQNYATDTSFFYLKDKKKRLFGVFQEGYIVSGMQWVDEKSRLIGKYDKNGAQGYCYNLKFNDYYAEGNYADDYLNGPNCLFLDFQDTSVYIGSFQKGKYTGKAIFVNKNNTIYDGDYLEGKFTGSGRVISNKGKTMVGTFKDGEAVKLTSILLPNGKMLNPNPSSFAEALNNVIYSYANYFDDVVGDFEKDVDLGSIYHGYLHYPGDSDPLSVTDFYSTDLYQSTLASEKDESAAEKIYSDFAKKILSTSITGIPDHTLKLQGEIKPFAKGDDVTISEFVLSDQSVSGYEDMKAWLVLVKADDSNLYSVLLVVGSMDEDSYTSPYVF